MAKTAMKVKQQRKQKFSTREYSRCRICGRPHAYLRKYGICRICFRELAYKGQIPSKLVDRKQLSESKPKRRSLNLVRGPSRTLAKPSRRREMSLVEGRYPYTDASHLTV